MIKDIVIIGASGLAKEVAFLIDDINEKKKQWKILGFIDKNESLKMFESCYNNYDLKYVRKTNYKKK